MNKFHTVFLFTAVFIVVAGLAFLSTRGNIFPNSKIELIAPYSFTGYSDIILEDGTKYRKKTPFAITTDKSFQVVLNLDNLGMIDNKSLAFITKNTTIRVEVDDRVIFRHFGVINKKKYAQNNSLILVDLPKRITSKEVILHYENTTNYPTIFELKDVKVGKRINLISNLFLSESILDYILLLLMIVIFFSTIFTANVSIQATSTEKYFRYIAFLSFSIFLYVFCNMSLNYFIFGRLSVFLHISKYTSLMFMPVFMLIAVTYRREKSDPILTIGIIINSLNIIIQYALVFLNIKTFSVMSSETCASILVSFIFILFSFLNARKEYPKITKIAFFSLIIGITYEVIFTIQKDYIPFSNVFKICIVIFALIQYYDLFIFYKIESEKRIKGQVYEKLAFIDKLTGLGNRLALSEKRVDYNKMKRAFYIVLFDINNLKYINDTYGHKYGDSTIKVLSDMLKEEFDTTYSRDLFRIGGDEFVMVYHAPKNINMEARLLELATRYENTQIEDMEANCFGVSYGFSWCDIEAGDDFSKKIHLADKNMYECKKKAKHPVREKTSR